MLRVLDGSCRTPVGVFSEYETGTLVLNGEILSPDGKEAFAVATIGTPDKPEAIGINLGERLLRVAGEDFIARFRNT
jgi:hydroxymethylbilane synthase